MLGSLVLVGVTEVLFSRQVCACERCACRGVRVCKVCMHVRGVCRCVKGLRTCACVCVVCVHDQRARLVTVAALLFTRYMRVCEVCVEVRCVCVCVCVGG